MAVIDASDSIRSSTLNREQTMEDLPVKEKMKRSRGISTTLLNREMKVGGKFSVAKITRGRKTGITHHQKSRNPNISPIKITKRVFRIRGKCLKR